MPVLDAPALVADRVAAIARYHRDAGVDRAEVDISGGIDSAVTVALVARALGPEQVTAAYMGIHSSDESRARAKVAAETAGVALIDVDLSDVFERAVAVCRDAMIAAGYDADAIATRCEQDPTVLGSIRSCLRAPIGRGLNRLSGGGIRHGTGNECEDRFLRFYQKGGDGEVDTNPIAMLSKGEVYQLALALGVPASLVDAVPTPDLHAIGEAHTDEDELHRLWGVPWTYSRVDVGTGRYRYVGTIERMSRFMDTTVAGVSAWALLTGAGDPDYPTLVAAARPFFPDHDAEKTEAFLRSARRVEAVTRHKHNPACPTLGARNEAVAAGLLSDTLPTP